MRKQSPYLQRRLNSELFRNQECLENISSPASTLAIPSPPYLPNSFIKQFTQRSAKWGLNSFKALPGFQATVEHFGYAMHGFRKHRCRCHRCHRCFRISHSPRPCANWPSHGAFWNFSRRHHWRTSSTSCGDTAQKRSKSSRKRFSAFLTGDVCMLIWRLHCSIFSLRGRIGISYTLKLGCLSQIILNSSPDIAMLLISRAKVCSVMERSVLLDKWFSGMSVAWSTPTAKAYQMLPVTLQELVAANVSLVNTTGGHIRSSLQTGPANDIQRNMLLCRICFGSWECPNAWSGVQLSPHCFVSFFHVLTIWILEASLNRVRSDYYSILAAVHHETTKSVDGIALQSKQVLICVVAHLNCRSREGCEIRVVLGLYAAPDVRHRNA